MEHTKKPKGKFLELLGNYDPHKKEFKIKMDRVEYWISKGAQLSPTVNNLLVNYKYWDKPKVMSWKPKNRQEISRESNLPTGQAKDSGQKPTVETEEQKVETLSEIPAELQPEAQLEP